MACYEYKGVKYTEEELVNLLQSQQPKTRRILELQSDLFQKGRDKKDLIGDSTYYVEGVGEMQNLNENPPNEKQNNFLQLLNKDNNWVTFFIKSIIQDSAKKGYEKVLFPTGNTASKVEGHSTLEEFKKERESRINEAEQTRPTITYSLGEWRLKDNSGRLFRDTFNSKEEATLAADKGNEEIDRLVNHFKQELERVEREGFGALKPIYNFYENTVGNILKKQGYNLVLITDEYGNTWQEIQIKESYKNNILLQKSNSAKPNNQQTIQLSKELLERIGVDYKKVKDIVVNGVKLDANGVADITKGVIQVIEGKESEALPEEVMHFAVEIIEQKNPKLFNKMLTEIGDFPIYKQVLSDYSNDSNYQINGKPDIRKLKKEAIAKQLVNTIINKVESSNYSQIAKTQNWWSEILQFIKNLFSQSGFDQAAMDIISGKEIGIIEDIRNKSKTTSEQLYLQQEAKKYAAQEIAEQFKSKEKPNERKFNRPTNLPEGFRVVFGEIASNRFIPSSSVDINELDNWQTDAEFYAGGVKKTIRVPYYKGIFGRNFTEILAQKGGGVDLDTKQRYANLRAIQSLSNIELHRRILTSLGISEIRIVDYNKSIPLFFNKGVIYINQKYWLENIEGLYNNNVNIDEYIDIAIFEELIHAVANKLYSHEELTEEFDILKDNEKSIGFNFYYDQYGDFSKESHNNQFQYMNELIRMKVQKDLIGKSTEDVANKNFIDSIVNKVWDFIISLFKDKLVKSNKIAENVKKFILEKEDFDINNINTNDILGAAPSNIQDSIFNKLKSTTSQIEKRGDEGYYLNGQKLRRVSDIVKDWYEKIFAEKQLTATEYDKAVYELKAETGTKGHKDIEHAFTRFVDENGYLREEPLPDDYVSQINLEDPKIYNVLKENLKKRLESFPPGTRFMTEATIYDANRRLAGTVDFLAITAEGKVSVLDWKFMDLNENKYQDVPWYKINAWNKQMEQYKLILEKAYSVKKQNFEQTRMIPIKANYTSGNRKENIKPVLTSIQIGDVNVKNIEDDYLLPVPLSSESTGNTRIDDLIEKLNAVYKKFSDKKVTPDKKAQKTEQLNSLFTAIRQLQVKNNLKPLIYQAKVLNKEIQSLIDSYNSIWKPSNSSQFSNKQISDLALDIENLQHSLQYYTTLDTDLKFLFKGELAQEDKDLQKDLKETVDNARELQSDLEEISKEFTDKFVAGPEIEGSILSPEKVITGITKWFSSTATLQMKSIETLFKKANRAFGFASFDTLNETKELEEIKRKYDILATSKGWNKNNYFNIIKKKDKNELIDQFDNSFYKLLEDKIKDKDISWIKENVDISVYKEHLKDVLKEEIDRIKNKTRIGTEEEIDTQISIEIQKAKRLYSIDQFDSLGLFLYTEIVKYPNKDKWETKEWKELHKKENQAALDFYNYIIKRNKFYASIDYINNKRARTFLPFVRKGVIEKILTNPKSARFGENFLRSVSIDEGDVGYGQIDPLTGKPIDTVPIYFTREIDGELSTDLFRTMALYNEAAIKYQYLSEIEPQIRALNNIEKNKKSIATSRFGKTVYKDGQLIYNPDNSQNAKLLEDMTKAIIYGQRYLESETFDQILGNIGKTSKKINDKLGFKLLPEELEGRQVSANKVIHQLNNIFQINALGLNPLSALSNLLGGTFQSIINAEKYFTKSDFIASELMLTANKFRSKEDQKKLIGALEFFLPLTDNYNKELAKNLSLSTLSQENIQEALMILMRKSDWFVQTANFYSFLKNTIVDEGKVVNVREYLKKQPEFIDMYKGNLQERKERKEKFEKEVIRLIEEKGVLKLSKIENNKLVIPGVKQKDESVIELRRKVQQLTKDALGNLSDDDLRTINMTIYGKSFMVFKNWVPRLVDVRTGNLKYNSASDAYEWGRMRMVTRLITKDLTKSLDSLKSSLTGDSEAFTNQFRELYETKKNEYEADTGKELNMTEAEFIDLVKKNVKSQLLDTIFLLSLFSLFLTLKAFAPDDDEDEKVKNSYRFMVKAVDKIKDELAYFYDPTSFTSFVSSGIFPSISYIENIKKLIVNFGKEMFAITIGDEELEEDTKVIKYLMKTFPVANQASQVLPMFSPELAKDLGIKMSTEARAGGK